MKVALYTGTFLKDQDGVARSISELVRSLLEHGIDLKIWTPALSGDHDRGLSIRKLPSVPLPLYRDYRISLPFKVRKDLDDFRPDIVHMTTPDLTGYRFLRYSMKRKVPSVSSYHTDFPGYLKYYHLGYLNGPAWKYLVWFYNKCGITLCPTRTIRDELRMKGISKVGVWSRGIRIDHFNPKNRSEELRRSWEAEGTIVVLYTGRFVLYKDIDVVVGVYERMKRTHAGKVKFVMCGDGPRRNYLENRMPDAVFPGYLTGKPLQEVYASSDVFLFPSTTETFGNVVLEAMASGLPAVVSDVGGCKEIVRESGAGAVAKARDVEDTFEKLKGIVDEREKLEQLGARAVEYGKNRSWEKVNERVIQTYESFFV